MFWISSNKCLKQQRNKTIQIFLLTSPQLTACISSAILIVAKQVNVSDTA
jgi:hypothetical protein